MVCAGVLGMASKFTEVSLALMYRETRPDGRVMGGAMFYLSKGLGEMGKGKLGKALSVAFAVACIGGSFGGGNTVQVSQSLGAVRQTLPFLAEHSWVYGLVMAVAVGSVIIGGIQRIAQVAEKIVPLMCGIYLLATMTILGMNAAKVPDAFMMILTEAFSPKAVAGGMMGVLVIGFRRAAFSNEAGVGSSAIAHSAARTPYAIREGIVALLEPFIDTVIVCTMTALMIVVTGAYNNPAYDALGNANDGAAMTSAAMGAELSFFPLVLSGIVILFAFSTMISWSYYGERCWAYLFGDNSSTSYRILFCVFTFLGSVVSATNILNLGDLMIFSMAFPNLLGVFLLAPKVRKEFTIYLAKLRAGEFKRYK